MSSRRRATRTSSAKLALALALIGLSLLPAAADDRLDDLLSALQVMPLGDQRPAPFMLDAKGEVSKQYDIAYTPTVFLVDRGGRLVGKAIGERQWMGEQGKALLRRLLARPS